MILAKIGMMALPAAGIKARDCRYSTIVYSLSAVRAGQGQRRKTNRLTYEMLHIIL